MHVELAKMLESLLSPAILLVGGAIAKFLRDISTELHGIKTAMAVTTSRVDNHDEILRSHNGRLHHLETEGRLES